MKKTIFITAFHSFVSRNILNSGVLEEIRKSGSVVVIFVLPLKLDFYKKLYQASGVFVEPFNPGFNTGYLESLFVNLAFLLVSTRAMRSRKIKIYQNKGGIFKYFFQIYFTKILGNLTWPKKIFRFVDMRLNNRDSFHNYISKYNPDLVFATDVFGSGDVALLKSAKKHHIRSVGMVASWDNNTTKGLMRVIPDRLLVQNEIIRDESISIQKVPENILAITGIAHYDYYLKYEPKNREEVLRRLGIDIKKRYIIFSPAGEKFITTDWQICEMLKKAFEHKKLPEDLVVLIRIHPTNPVNLELFVSNEHFIIEKPGISFEGLGDKRKELDVNSVNDLIDTIHHSELVVNVLSSIAIDAAVLDKPIVTVGFNGWEHSVPFGSSVERYLSDENMENLIYSGGVSVSNNEEELINNINKYLDNPRLDREKREKLVSQQCWKLDGLSNVRVADEILKEYK